MRITSAQFQKAQSAIDALIRAARRGKDAQQIEHANDVAREWEAANALPQRTQRDLAARDEALHVVAVKHGLI